MQPNDINQQIDFIYGLLASLEIDAEHSPAVLELPFKKLEDWSSMKSLLMVVEIEEKFGVLLSGEEVKDAQTFSDILNIVLLHLAE